jgi:hypothetical protein
MLTPRRRKAALAEKAPFRSRRGPAGWRVGERTVAFGMEAAWTAAIQEA